MVAGSRSTTVIGMDVIFREELRDHVSEALRRVEAGESLLVSVAAWASRTTSVTS